MRTPQIGTVYNGLVFHTTLIPILINELSKYNADKAKSYEEHYSTSNDDDSNEQTVSSLFNDLNEIAGEGQYFGSKPDEENGISFDYGFWENQ